MHVKGRILVVASSADRFTLKTGQTVEAGYYLNELAVPALAAIDAGYQIRVATPRGNRPVVDRQSLVASHFGGSELKLLEALDFAASNPSLEKPNSIRSTIEEGLENYVGLFVPGGHPPMIDLMQDPDLGVVLRHFHAHSKPTALLGHGPITAAAAMPRARAFRQALVDGAKEAAAQAAAGWQYAGYRMTVFSNDEEKYAEDNLMGGGKVPFYPATALEIAGARVETNGFFEPHVVQDRELITGQNPPSDHAIAELFVRTLDRYTGAKAAA
jgi:putative intracellular protease/amidase